MLVSLVASHAFELGTYIRKGSKALHHLKIVLITQMHVGVDIILLDVERERERVTEVFVRFIDMDSRDSELKTYLASV